MTSATPPRAGSAPPIRGRDGFNNSPPARVEPRRIQKPAATSSISNGQPPHGAPPRVPVAHSKQKPKRARKPTKQYVCSGDIAERCSVAMSRTETILVSSSGDVIVCRCRKSSQPYSGQVRQDALEGWSSVVIPCCDTDCIGGNDNPWSPVFDTLKVTQQVSGEISQASEMSTYEWEQADKFVFSKRGLLGGAIHSPIHDVKHGNQRQEEDATVVNNEPKSQGSQSQAPVSDDSADEMNSDIYDGGILPLPSFDYSHFSAGDNDMISVSGNGDRRRRKSQLPFPTIKEGDEKKADDGDDRNDASDVEQFVHGVPKFLSSLSQIRITKVSAHPLGAHVLLISAEAILFSYGLNNHGQLGIGMKFSVNDNKRGFLTNPIIITPLLENGGKAINCAAGVDHSIVVVSTEGRRIQKVQTDSGDAQSDVGALSISRVTSSPSRLFVDKDDDDRGSEAQSIDTANEAVRHHQLYGFGNNEFMKLGLVNASSENSESETDGLDVVLPRRVALHCTVWPQKAAPENQSLPPHGVFDVAASAEHSAALVRRATGDVEVYMWGNASLGALGQVDKLDSENSSRTPSSRKGKSRRTTVNKIFPLPTVVEDLSHRYSRDGPGGEFPRQVTLGPYCTFVVMSSGRCLSCGYSPEGMLGQGHGVSHAVKPTQIYFPKDTKIVSISSGAYHCVALSDDGNAYSWGINSHGRLGLENKGEYLATYPKEADESLKVVEWLPQKVEVTKGSVTGGQDASNSSQKIIKVCAGYDGSMLVVDSGKVLSFGKKSGRLGLGELTNDVNSPQPLFGGLRLFRGQTRIVKS